jgi:hypothetical protein
LNGWRPASAVVSGQRGAEYRSGVLADAVG